MIAEARSWLDTPFAYRGRKKGWAVDCWGLVVCVGVEAGVLSLTDEDFEPWARYGRLPDSEHMRAGLHRFLKPVEEPIRPADIGFFYNTPRARHGPMHLAIFGSYRHGLTMIHADATASRHRQGGKGRVVEHGYRGEWPGRLDSLWRYPGLA